MCVDDARATLEAVQVLRSGLTADCQMVQNLRFGPGCRFTQAVCEAAGCRFITSDDQQSVSVPIIFFSF